MTSFCCCHLRGEKSRDAKNWSVTKHDRKAGKLILVCLEIWFKKKVQKGAAVKDLPSAIQLLLLLRLSVEHTDLESIWKIMRASYTNKQAHRYTHKHTHNY